MVRLLIVTCGDCSWKLREYDAGCRTARQRSFYKFDKYWFWKLRYVNLCRKQRRPDAGVIPKSDHFLFFENWFKRGGCWAALNENIGFVELAAALYQESITTNASWYLLQYPRQWPISSWFNIGRRNFCAFKTLRLRHIVWAECNAESFGILPGCAATKWPHETRVLCVSLYFRQLINLR